MDRASARRARTIARACYAAADDDLSALRVRLLAGLRSAVGVDAAFFAVADPDTLLFTFAHADDPLVAAGPRFLESELGEHEDVNRFAALARARRPVASLDASTRGRRAASARFREVIAPLGFGDELRVALRVGAVTWGFLCLHREGATSFSAADIEIVGAVAPHAGEAIRRIVGRGAAGDGAADAEPAVVLVRADRVIAATSVASSWLEELGLRVAVGAPVPLPLRGLLRRTDVPGAVRLITRRGAVLEAHAARLCTDTDGGTVADATIAVTFAPARASSRAAVRLAARGLTPAQRRVAELVLRGRSTKEIVEELRIGEHTVQDHLKAVFDKMGVGSRRELVAALVR